MKAVLSISLFLIYLTGSGQHYQQKYLEGKALYRTKKYRLAMETFRALTNTNEKHDLSEYASFYFALAAYREGQVYVARDMFKQILKRFKSWRKKDEVYLWLSQIGFELDQYSEALDYLQLIVSDQVAEQGQALKSHHLHKIDSIEVLQNLQAQYPNDKTIASALINRIENQPLADKNIGLMEKLVNQFNLDKVKNNVPDYSKNERKTEYLIGVLLPFMFESYDDMRSILRNFLVNSLYEGMLIAEEELINSGQSVRLVPYDTKRNKDTTLEIINQTEFGSMDLIIGPLYPGPSKFVSQFSYDQKVNMINPLSSNSAVIGNNPYSFLFEPSIETQAKKAAQYAKRHTNKKTAVILYEDNPKDSLFAHIYKAEIEKDSIAVIWFEKFNKTQIHKITEVLTEVYKRNIPKDMVDSLLEIEDYPMQLYRKTKPTDPDKYYEELLVIAPDSIGHILTASNKLIFAANSLSAINIRGDSIPLIGREEWLEYSSVSFDQLEQLDVTLIAPTFYDETAPSYRALREKTLERYQTTANQYHVIGYDLIHYFGKAMHNFGKYFQVGLRKEEVVKGKILQGLQYGTKNDNQLVPLIKFSEGQLKRIDNLNQFE